MKEFGLDFCFKGSRTYVHGTDIYTKILELLDGKMKHVNFDLSFHGVSKTNMKLSLTQPKDESLLKFACKYVDMHGNKKILYGIENSQTIACRYEYQEKNIYESSELDISKKSVMINEENSYSFIENAVALNKYLLDNLFPDLEGKWYFTRLQLKEIPRVKYYPISIHLKANFNFKLTKSEIFINDKLVGFIYFSLV